MDTSIGTIWEHVARALPEAAAVVYDGQTWSYRELDEAAGRLASSWQTDGIHAHDRVGCFLYNSVHYMQTQWAAYKISAIPVNVNYRYRGPELAYLINDSNLKAIVFHPELAPQLAEALPLLTTRPVLLQAGGEIPLVEGAQLLQSYSKRSEPVQHAYRDRDDQLFLYTGGTTGSPKAVVWSQGDQFDSLTMLTYTIVGKPVPSTAAEAAMIAQEMHAEGISPITLPVAPLMHGTALTFATSAFCVGGTLVFTSDRSLVPASIWNLVESQAVTHMVVAGNAIAAPLATELERAAHDGHPWDTSTVRLMASSGVQWSDDVKASLLRHGVKRLFETIAASEGGPFAYASAESTADLPTRFMLASDAVVLDDDDNAVAPGSDTVGVLAFHGSMPLGYFNDESKTASTYRTIRGRRHVMPGDYVRLRADSSLEFIGRGSTVINTGGEKVFTHEVEAAIMSHPSVHDCAVLGAPDPRWNQIVTAVVVAEAGLTSDAIANQVGEKLAGYKKPRRVIFVHEIPRGPNGKLVPADLRKIVAHAAEGQD